ncbi:MAG: type I secretion system permease/ATPase [Gallionella sp.]|nr:MAG: type I secretion system permease/ATPase [Gallionella sp.]
MIQDGQASPLTRATEEAKRILGRVAGFSFLINLLMLVSPLYMLQIYDRVLSSGSNPTLLYLTLFAAACLFTMAALELVRSRILVRLGGKLDGLLSHEVFASVLTNGRTGQSFRDLDNLRAFLTGAGMLALLDAPWTPVYIALVYALHPMLGHVALAGAIILFVLGLMNERATRAPLMKAGMEMAASTQFAELSARNSDVVHAMGMLPGLQSVWRKRHDMGLRLQAEASDRAGEIAAMAKFVRIFLQVAILGVGAYLVIEHEATAGAMIAASIIMGRGLAPVESAIGAWRGFLQAREGHGRLKEELEKNVHGADPMQLPAPSGALSLENVIGIPPGAQKPVINNITAELKPGVSLGITGPSAAGKSSLARLIVGVWKPVSGTVRLDGVNLATWRREEVGPNVGYLPQDIELFPGTVAENIARFGRIDSSMVVEAATLAGAHQTILELPDGYDTIIGPAGNNLSGGQRQRIGLARAFYGTPSLIVLDEPSSNLDAEGEAAVRQAIDELRKMRKTVVVIAHRPSLLGGTDALMVIQHGTMTNFGPTHQIMPLITRPTGAVPEQAPGVPVEASHGV